MRAIADQDHASCGCRPVTTTDATGAEVLGAALYDQGPLPEGNVDVVISNCVINLSADKPLVLREAARVLVPGGRLAVSDVIADPDLDDATSPAQG